MIKSIYRGPLPHPSHIKGRPHQPPASTLLVLSVLSQAGQTAGVGAHLAGDISGVETTLFNCCSIICIIFWSLISSYKKLPNIRPWSWRRSCSSSASSARPWGSGWWWLAHWWIGVSCIFLSFFIRLKLNISSCVPLFIYFLPILAVQSLSDLNECIGKLKNRYNSYLLWIEKSHKASTLCEQGNCK